ncbi:putative zinc finger protein [Orchesella cincta]|uniref:Putative zinc finger protein n=1 Tax=Orchesella cincta TaxID=48709 RepID=A0A1D2MEJ7_ORCCI|nr:putative zinc finger protein [Orchesella cincta]
MYETKRKEESDSDSTFEPDASPEHNSNESDSDSQSDREPASIKSNAKSPLAHHQPPKKKTETKPMCLQHCGKVLISSQRLRHHIYQVHRGHPFQCSECSKSFKTKAALKDHAIRTHSENHQVRF